MTYQTLEELRKAKGLKANYVAEKLGITRNAYHKKEKKISPVTVSEGINLSMIFGVEVQDIYNITRQK